MAISPIANPVFFTGSSSLMPLVKTGVLALALHAIQNLGVSAKNTFQTDYKNEALESNLPPHIYDHVQDAACNYNRRVHYENEKLRGEGIEWIVPKRPGEWEKVEALAARYSVWNTAACNLLSFQKSRLNPLLSPEFDKMASNLLECQKMSTYQYYQTLLRCKYSEDMTACLTQSNERTATLQALATKIQTVLPQNAQESKSLRIEDCFSTDCSPVDKAKLHERERAATETVGTSKQLKSKRERLQRWFVSNFIAPEWHDVQEILRFRSDDPREKLLFISTEKDSTKSPALQPWLISGILSKLAQKYDLKFQVVDRWEDICPLIESGKKTGNLAHVIINGHGSPSGIVFDAKDVVENGNTYWDVNNKMFDTEDFSKCFSGVRPNGKILLMSCSTGGIKKNKNGYPFDNIAQKMADGAKRTVVAPKNLAHPLLTDFVEEDAVLFEHESLFSFLPFYKANLYESFRPQFYNCFPKIDRTKIFQRELSAVDVIKTELIAKSLLHDQQTFGADEYLQVCQDDPKEKVVVLSAQHDHNGALNPEVHKKVLSVLADRFDLFYKSISYFNEICRAIDLASQSGKVINVIIQAHGTPMDGMTLLKDKDGNEQRLNESSDFANCFSKVDKEGTIVLMGSSLGQQDSRRINLAQKVANEANRTVIATTCPIFPSDMKIQSIDPLMIEHSSYSTLYNLFVMGCPENNNNHFKTFTPES